MQAPCIYSDGWRKPHRTKNTSFRIRDSVLRAHERQAHELLEEPAESCQRDNDNPRISWPVAGHRCPVSDASEESEMQSEDKRNISHQLSGHSVPSNMFNSELEHAVRETPISCCKGPEVASTSGAQNVTHESAEIPGCVNASYVSDHSMPSNAFDSVVNRDVCETRISPFAEAPEVASSSRCAAGAHQGVQQEVPTNEENESERPSGFLAVAPLNASSVGAGRNRRSLACYRRQAAAEIASSIPPHAEMLAEPELQPKSVGMVSKKLILHAVWAVFGIVPWSTQSCTVVYRYVVISLAVCLSVLSATSCVVQTQHWNENLITCGIAVFTTMFLVAAGKLSDILGPADHLLWRHSQYRGFTWEWERDGVVGALVSAGICILVTGSNLTIGLLLEPERLPLLCLTSYGVITFIMITQCLSHIILFLDLLVNSFVDQFITTVT